MPGVAIQFFIVSLCIGQSFGTEITIIWIITSIITSTILTIATPPIPGGGLSCYTILFTQLGIPSAGIALVISIELLMDAFLTACNLAFLQTELVLSAKKLNLLDEEKLPWVMLWDKTGFPKNSKTPSAIQAAYGFYSIPFLVVIDKEGKLAARNVRGEQVREAILKIRK